MTPPPQIATSLHSCHCEEWGSRSPEGAAPASGESRGVQPHWQESWRMCLHNLLLFTFPLPYRKGARGDGPRLNRSAAPASRESRGVQPHWQEAWRMCLHNLLLFTFPLPGRKGPAGWSEPQSKRSPRKRGVQRAPPFGRGLGVSPRDLSWPPSLQEGGQGDGPN